MELDDNTRIRLETTVVNKAYLVTWIPYAQFHPNQSINEFLAAIMMFYGCGNDQTTPMDTIICD